MYADSVIARTRGALSIDDGRLLRRGTPHRILSGSIHYFRVHPEQWADRLGRLAAMGLNTVDTYVAWNVHQPRPGIGPRFDGWADVERFVSLAGEAGLDVIVRPGPYICAEWDNGGFPAWVTDRTGAGIRSSDPLYLSLVAQWFDELIPRIADLQASRGGPVVAVQVENEYGSYGRDSAYLSWLRDALVDRGIDELLYTADGPVASMLDGGRVLSVLQAATFGSHPGRARALLEARHPGQPFFCAEYWNGWFDHWGEEHHVRSVASADEDLAGILETGGSVSIYMAHGGTNFGLWAGANHDGTRLQPTVTSYDSDAPIAEHGAITPKFLAYRRRFAELTGRAAAPVPRDPDTLAPRSIPLGYAADLLPALRALGGAPVAAPHPVPFSGLGLASGFALYRARVDLPTGPAPLAVTGLHDRAQVFVDGRLAGAIEGDGCLELPQRTRSLGSADLELLVENQGRINYGPLLGQDKGILGGVRLDGILLEGWTSIPLPADEWTGVDLDRAASAAPTATGGPCLVSADLEVDAPADAFLELPGFRKGLVWIGDVLLGRYWDRGPQRTLYVPAPLLHSGTNRITVLESESPGSELRIVDAPALGPEQEFVESFD